MNYLKSSSIFLTLMLFSGTILMAQTFTEVRTTDEFSAINAGSIFKIELTQGETYFLEIETEEKLLENVETAVKNGVLHLNFKGSTRNATIIARIISPVIEKITLSGASSLKGLTVIESNDLELNLSGATGAELSVITETLKTNISGASNLRIDGVSGHHSANVSGASQLRALDLETETTIIKTSGASNARIMAKEYLEANASGTSSIRFDHQPASQKFTTSGMASINDLRTSGNAVMIGDPADTTRIRLGGRDFLIIDDEQTRIKTVQRRAGFRKNWSGFEMGINGYLTPDNSLTLTGDADYIDLRYNKSVVVNLNFWQQSFPIISNNLGLVTGLGLGFNNYRFDNQTRIVYNREGLDFYEDTINSITKNKLTLTWINLPLLLEFQTRGRGFEKFHIAGGMILGTRIGTHAKYVTDDAGKKRKEKDYHDFHVPPFRFDLTGRIGWGSINLFATYSLNNLFKDDKGPELVPFSVGIRLVNW
ncbi:MAG: DUF2807 domain-containing protein [Bacteroidales bacterium]|nr:DUF2807 domain-containing protein [Bacteroidales bacterium]